MHTLFAVAAGLAMLSAADDVTLSITKITETRVAEVTPAKKSEFAFMDDKPVMKVAMQVSLPEGTALINMGEPTSIEAKDDTGKDLTNIDKSFGGEKQFWMMSFGDDMKEGKVTLQLLPSAREAKTMSLSMRAQASVATGTKDFELARGKNWAKLDEETFGEGAEYRVSRAKGKVYVDVKPEEFRERIEVVAFVSEASGEPIASDSTMWSEEMVTYGFPEDIKDDMALAVRARTGFETREVKIEAKGLKLP